MSRTAINLTGDLVACTVMDRWVGGKETGARQLAQKNIGGR
jgi:Na+/H+-dicarboxylate symporter